MAGLLIGTGRCRFTVRLRVRSQKFMNGLLRRLITPTQLELTATDDDGPFYLPHRHNFQRRNGQPSTAPCAPRLRHSEPILAVDYLGECWRRGLGGPLSEQLRRPCCNRRVTVLDRDRYPLTFNP